MTAHDPEHRDLTAALAAARRPIEPPAMPSASFGVRLKTSSALRRLLPTPLVVRRAERRGRARWKSAGERERALAAMDAIVGGTARAGEVEELARRYLIEDEVHRALFWQPWKTASMDAASDANLRTALSAERGVLISACHLGPMFLYMSALDARGLVPYVASAPWFFQKPSEDLWGRRIARWWQGLQRRNERLVYSVGSFPVLRSLLEQGEVVLIYFDMPGSRRTPFLGKPVMLASGTARLSFETGAPIVPMRARRVGHRVWADAWTPLDPRDFADVGALQNALAATHSRSVLELAETLEDPNRAGAWEGGANRDEWARLQ